MMATDGPDPVPCDHDIFANGVTVFVTHSIPSNAMEYWVRQVAEQSGQPVDWHFVGGRACVKTTGVVWKVSAAIIDLKDEHDRLQKTAIDEMWR